MLKRFLAPKTRFLCIITSPALILLFLGGCAGTPKGAWRSDPQMGKEILHSARSQIGKPYRFGGRSPKKGFDCSGLAWWSHKVKGITIPRESWNQFRFGQTLSRKELMPGDLVYFETYKKGASHVGIYDGKGGFIHAPSSGKKVQRTPLSDTYYKKRYLGARRFW